MPRRLQELFTTPELDESYSQIHTVMRSLLGPELGDKKLQVKLRHLLKKLALSLEREASIPLQKKAAKYLKHRSRNLAYIISGTLSKGKDKKPEPSQYRDNRENIVQVEQVKQNLLLINNGDDDDSDVEDIDEDPPMDERFSSIEQYISNSNSMLEFKAGLNLLLEEITKIQDQDAAIKEAGSYPKWSQKVEVKWTCSCGQQFSEQVIEYRPGAAQRLAPSSTSTADTTTDIERVAGSTENSARGQPPNNASAPIPRQSAGSSEPQAGHTEAKENATTATPKEGQTKEVILFCRRKETSKIKVYYADITTALCDYTTFHVLHQQYYGAFNNQLLQWLYFKKISTVDFVRFSLYCETYVSIGEKDYGVFPHPDSEDYSFKPSSDTEIPVLKSVIAHFIEEPHHAQKSPIERPQIPKRVGGQLILTDAQRKCEGYGLYIQEGVDWRKVLIAELLFATACIAFAVIWCMKNQGGIQDGFTIAGTGIAYATIFLGALQALSSR